MELTGTRTPDSMEGVSLAACLEQHEHCPKLDAFNETGIWITAVPGLPEQHLQYPDLLELIEVPDKGSGTLAIKSQYYKIILQAKDRMIRHDKWKLVYQPLDKSHLLRLYNLEEDPECRQDVLSIHPEIAKHLWKKLSHWLAADGVGDEAIENSPTATATSS